MAQAAEEEERNAPQNPSKSILQQQIAETRIDSSSTEQEEAKKKNGKPEWTTAILHKRRR